VEVGIYLLRQWPRTSNGPTDFLALNELRRCSLFAPRVRSTSNAASRRNEKSALTESPPHSISGAAAQTRGVG
jgi:hypothetical protein